MLLCQVSKQFHDLTCDPAIWKTLYANARLPHPPGPFPCQTIRFLEHTLVESEWLANWWTSRPMREISREGIHYAECLICAPKIFYGRWLIRSEAPRKLVVHDLDSTAWPHLPIPVGITDTDLHMGCALRGRCQWIAYLCTEYPTSGVPGERRFSRSHPHRGRSSSKFRMPRVYPWWPFIFICVHQRSRIDLRCGESILL